MLSEGPWMLPATAEPFFRNAFALRTAIHDESVRSTHVHGRLYVRLDAGAAWQGSARLDINAETATRSEETEPPFRVYWPPRRATVRGRGRSFLPRSRRDGF